METLFSSVIFKGKGKLVPSAYFMVSTTFWKPNFLNLAEVKAVHFTCRFHHPRVEINIVAHQNQRVGMTSLFGVLDRLPISRSRL